MINLTVTIVKMLDGYPILQVANWSVELPAERWPIELEPRRGRRWEDARF